MNICTYSFYEVCVRTVCNVLEYMHANLGLLPQFPCGWYQCSNQGMDVFRERSLTAKVPAANDSCRDKDTKQSSKVCR